MVFRLSNKNFLSIFVISLSYTYFPMDLFDAVENNFHYSIFCMISFYFIRNNEVTEAFGESMGIN